MGGSGSNEKPQEVTLTKPFWLGRTEVTQAQWEAVMGSNPSRFKGKDLPIENASWGDAQEFCKKLNGKSLLPSGWQWALPTEAQWEFACRAGTTSDYAGNLGEMAWYDSNSGSGTHPVATRKANAWGLYDMHGNVWEWCADWYANHPGGAATDPIGPSTGSARVYRGGSWSLVGSGCRSASRDWSTPGKRDYSLGFRVAAVPAGAVVAAGVAVASDARAAPLAGTSAAELAAAKVGARLAADLGGGTALVLLGVPAGTFTMGGSGLNEKPQEVTLTNPIWLGRTEVTHAQWEAVMGSNPSTFKGDPNLPVEQLSWNDASEFCKKLNAKTLLPAGWRWTLPSEAQWEYACRAGTVGDYAGSLDDMAWYSANSGSKTHAVGTKKSNAWGLYDMHGNVDEWCADWYGDYPGGAATDPTGPNTGSDRVLRSGSWIVGGGVCRSAYHSRRSPDGRYWDIGFRVAAVPTGAIIPVGGAGAIVPAGVAGAVVPAGVAGARDARAAQLAGTSAAELTAVKVGAQRAADLGGGTALVLLGVPAGTFTMGGSGSHEEPQEVTLANPFWLGRTEVTQAQWEAVMGSNPSKFKGDPNLPVEQVSWNDASEFCKKLNAKGLLPAGWRWTLPSEAQWEYACRAGTRDEYAGSLDAMAWYSSNSGRKTHPVATRKANAWGLYDMHGNVWEWCADWYANHPGGAATNPTGPNTGSNRVYRGGSWSNGGTNCRSAYRRDITPVSRRNFIGFRVAAVLGGS